MSGLPFTLIVVSATSLAASDASARELSGEAGSQQYGRRWLGLVDRLFRAHRDRLANRQCGAPRDDNRSREVALHRAFAVIGVADVAALSRFHRHAVRPRRIGEDYIEVFLGPFRGGLGPNVRSGKNHSDPDGKERKFRKHGYLRNSLQYRLGQLYGTLSPSGLPAHACPLRSAQVRDELREIPSIVCFADEAAQRMRLPGVGTPADRLDLSDLTSGHRDLRCSFAERRKIHLQRPLAV